MSKNQYQQRMSKVVDYIEKHLDSQLNIERLSKIACYSEFHFHRIFRAYVGESIYAFKKRLLLERAVKQLRFSKDSITEVAFNCGYDNQASFNKAFKKHYSVTPSQVRSKRVSIQLTINQPHTWQENSLPMTKRQKDSINPEIRLLKPINLIGARARGQYQQAASEAWGKIMKFAYSNRLMKKEVRLFGLSHDDPSVTEPEHIRYDACLDLEVDIHDQPDLMKQSISSGNYAVFLHKGSYEGLAELYAYAFNRWLPESQYKLRDSQCCFEVYLNRDPRRTKPENLKTEVYIPLNKV